MPNCDFHSVGEDSERIVEFVFSHPGWILYEKSSQPGAEVRRRLNRFIHSASVASAGSRPILPVAHRAVSTGALELST